MILKRTRIMVDVDPALRRKLRLVAAKRDTTVKQYVLSALTVQLRRDQELTGDDALLGLTAEADPVLAELWDNPKDEAYDHL